MTGTWRYGTHKLFSAAAFALLSGCGALSITPQIAPVAAGSLNPIVNGGSWMLPEASTEDLLYIANNNATVTVYTYPYGKQVGTLRGFDIAEGECVDKDSDVFITVSLLQEVLEYRHGGAKPIATLKNTGYFPFSCSVDPTTGNLAVVDSSGVKGAGAVSIYPNRRGPPKKYTAENIIFYHGCGYDNKGNLFINGYGSNGTELDELVKGSDSFKTITLDVSGLEGGVQWDGKHLAIGDGSPITQKLYQFAISGNTGLKTGSTTLTGGDSTFFWIDGPQIAALNDQANIGIWKYPTGGKPTKVVYQNVSFPVGVTISPALSRNLK